MREQIEQEMKVIQDSICEGLEILDSAGKFKEDFWQREEGGGGRTRIINGRIIEKGGVNFSAVYGPLSKKISSALKIPASEFFATGVSIVLHPVNPWVPIIHMNVRYFETSSGHSWFGGGIDVTPHYVNLRDAIYFHRYLKDVCDKHDRDYYPAFKRWADQYFYIRHRKESRGIGGIFFDRLSVTEKHDMNSRWKFVREIAYSFIPIYTSLVEHNFSKSYNADDIEWQMHRRGRYVEFNLVWDKGTKFGLDTDGRIESILMSLPPTVKWTYDFKPHQNDLAWFTQKVLQAGAVDWVRN